MAMDLSGYIGFQNGAQQAVAVVPPFIRPTNPFTRLDLIPTLRMVDPADCSRESNYDVWKDKVESYLTLQNLNTYIEGNPWPLVDVANSETPAQYAARTAPIQEATQLIYAIISLVIEEGVMEHLLNINNKDGYEAWFRIEELLLPINDASYVQRLGDKFRDTRYDPSKPVDEYITKMVALGRHLRKAGRILTDTEVASQILRGLPPRYNNFRETILNHDPEPSTSKIAERLRAKELRYAAQNRELEKERALVASYNARAMKKMKFRQPPGQPSQYQQPGYPPTPHQQDSQQSKQYQSRPGYQPYQQGPTKQFQQQERQQGGQDKYQQYLQQPRTQLGPRGYQQQELGYQGIVYATPNSFLFCVQCQKISHVKEDCWELFPARAPKKWLDRRQANKASAATRITDGTTRSGNND